MLSDVVCHMPTLPLSCSSSSITSIALEPHSTIELDFKVLCARVVLEG